MEPEQQQEEKALADTGQQLTTAPEVHPPASVLVPPTVAGETIPFSPTSVPSIPDYHILSELGKGGMGVVYKARHAKLDRVVAIKMIRSSEFAGAEERARFRTEAEAVARLHHPNIVQIYDIGECEGQPYFSLEFCDEGSLDRKLGGKPLPPLEAAALVESLARAMHVVHLNKIVHRDLKPANVLLKKETGDRRQETEGKTRTDSVSCLLSSVSYSPKITDFGLARKLDAPRQTQTGAVMGTPSYMAPEQAAGRSEAIEARTDVYALGAILYECLTGRPPFQAPTNVEILVRVVGEEPVTLRQLQPHIPRDLETICLKCLHKEIDKRYASAEALAQDLAEFQAGRPIRARPVGAAERAWRWCRRNPVLAITGAAACVAVLVTLVTLAVSVLLVTRSRDDAEKLATKNAALAKTERGLRDAADEHKKKAVWDAINLQVQQAYSKCVQEDAGRGLLWFARCLRNARQAETADLERSARAQLMGWGRYVHPLQQILQHKEWVRVAVLSPDGKTVFSGCDDRTAQLWDVGTGQTRHVLKPSWQVLSAAFSPDSRQLLTGCANAAELWDVETGKPLGQAWRFLEHIDVVAFSPDGKTVLVGGKSKDGKGEARLFTLPLGFPTGEPLRHQGVIKAAAFSPDGQYVLTGGGEFIGQGEARLWEARTGKPIGGRMHQERVEVVAFSPDSSIALTGSADATVRLWEAKTGKAIGAPLAHSGWITSSAFSPDGRYFATASNRVAQIWETRSRTALGSPLTHPRDVLSVAFSGDSKTVVTGSTDDAARLWLIEPTRSTGEQQDSRSAPFTPDLLAAFSAIALQDSGGQAPSSLGPFSIAYPGSVKQLGPPLWHRNSVWLAAFSRDGRTLMTKADKEVRLWQPATGGSSGMGLPCTGEAKLVKFSGDGQSVLTGGGYEARVWEVKTGKPLGPPVHFGRDMRESDGAIALSADAKSILTGNYQGTAQLWETATGNRFGPALQHPKAPQAFASSPVRAVAFSPDGQSVLTYCGKDLYRWNAATGVALGKPASLDIYSYPTGMSHDGTRLLLVAGGPQADSKATASLWDTASGTQVGAPLADVSRINVIAFSADDTKVVVGCEDGTARVLNARTSEVLTPPLKHGLSIRAVAISSDGALVATASGYETQLWDVASGKPTRAPFTQKSGITAVAFSRDLQTVATGSWNEALTGEVQLWDVPTGNAIGLPVLLPLHVHALSFSPDGTTLAVATGMAAGRNRAGESRLLPVAALEGDVERITLWTQVITGMDLSDLGVVRLLEPSAWQERRRRLHELDGTQP